MQNKAEAQLAWLQLAAGAAAGAQLSLAKNKIALGFDQIVNNLTDHLFSFR